MTSTFRHGLIVLLFILGMALVYMLASKVLVIHGLCTDPLTFTVQVGILILALVAFLLNYGK